MIEISSRLVHLAEIDVSGPMTCNGIIKTGIEPPLINGHLQRNINTICVSGQLK